MLAAWLVRYDRKYVAESLNTGHEDRHTHNLQYILPIAMPNVKLIFHLLAQQKKTHTQAGPVPGYFN